MNAAAGFPVPDRQHLGSVGASTPTSRSAASSPTAGAMPWPTSTTATSRRSGRRDATTPTAPPCEARTVPSAAAPPRSAQGRFLSFDPSWNFVGDYVLDWSTGNTFKPRTTDERLQLRPLQPHAASGPEVERRRLREVHRQSAFRALRRRSCSWTTTTDAQIAPTGNFGGTEVVNCDNPMLSPQQRDLLCTQAGFGPNDYANVITLRRNVEGGPRVEPAPSHQLASSGRSSRRHQPRLELRRLWPSRRGLQPAVVHQRFPHRPHRVMPWTSSATRTIRARGGVAPATRVAFPGTSSRPEG